MKIKGTDDREYLQDHIGTDDFVFGLGGDDVIGDDLRMGGQRPSDDRYYGGKGADQIRSLIGNDHLYGQRGNDELDIWKDVDRHVVARGGPGNDTLTLWGFDEDRAEVEVKDGKTVVEQGSNKIVIHDDVEEWHFFEGLL